MRPQTKVQRLSLWLLVIAADIWLAACAPSIIETNSNPQIGHSTDRARNPAKDVNGPANSKGKEQEPAKAEIEIKIKDFVFDPPEVNVVRGTRITWINEDEAPHTATSTENKFNSGGLDTDDRYSFVFNEKGDFPYICSLHPHMKAVIKVR